MRTLLRLDPSLDVLLHPQEPPDWQEILKYFRGSELQNYFTKILEDNLKALIKPQYVDQIPKTIKGDLTVGDMLTARSENDNFDFVVDELDLRGLLDRQPKQLSGGELQRFAIAVAAVQKADVYEPKPLAALKETGQGTKKN